MLRGKGRNAFELEVVFGIRQGVANRVDARVEEADDVTGKRLLHNLPLLGHHGLGLGQADILAALYVVDGHAGFELPGHNPKEGNPVPVGLVHIGLDLEDEAGEVGTGGLNDSRIRFSRQRRRRHLQKIM